GGTERAALAGPVPLTGPDRAIRPPATAGPATVPSAPSVASTALPGTWSRLGRNSAMRLYRPAHPQECRTDDAPRRATYTPTDRLPNTPSVAIAANASIRRTASCPARRRPGTTDRGLRNMTAPRAPGSV